MTSRMCRALYSVHSFKPVLVSLSEQPNSQLSAFPQGVMVGSRCYRSSIDSWLMEFRRAISPECQYPIRGLFGILSFYVEWKDQSLRIFHKRLWGQILPFALCATCITVKLKLREFGGRVCPLKNVWTNRELLMYSFHMAIIVLEGYYIINCLRFWLFFFMFKFSLQILLSMEWFIWGQVLQRIDFWDQKWSRLFRLQHETFKVSSQSRKALIGLWCGMTNRRNTLYFALGLILEK